MSEHGYLLIKGDEFSKLSTVVAAAEAYFSEGGSDWYKRAQLRVLETFVEELRAFRVKEAIANDAEAFR